MSTISLEKLLDNPQDIFKLQNDKSVKENLFNELTKSIINPIVKDYSVLDEIYINGLDSSQVFGQTKMVLDGIGRQLLGEDIPSIKESIVEEEEEEEEVEEEDEEELNDQDDEVDIDGEELVQEDESEEVSEDEEDFDLKGNEVDSEENEKFDDDRETLVESEEETNESGAKKDGFGLNDGFFDLDQFNKQILAMEKEPEDDEEIDYFGNMSEDEEDEEEMDYYNDFYDKPGQFTKKNQPIPQPPEDEEISESEFLDDDYDKAVESARLDLFAEEEAPQKENLSSFEKQQRSLQQEIAKLEAELVADKKWTLKGEITSNDRPKESLLEENELSFDRTAKPVPTITEEITESIEDLIRKRIKNDEFNDLPKRIITDLSRFHKGPQAEVSEQKSSKSLAELYEDEYNDIDAQQEELNEEEKRQHEEISGLFTNVIHKLDALCSAHFIPKPHQSKNIEIKVTDSSPAAISMEDAQPLHVSSESRLAPQEIYKIGDDSKGGNGPKGKSEVLLKSGLSYSKDELDRDEKQRLRRANKRKKSKIYKEREENKRQRTIQQPLSTSKRSSNNDVINTLSRAKNITVVGKKGEKTDIKGNLKKAIGPQTSNNFKL
ncbi:MPP10 [Candida jiufengensis]|uniref:MPP10 n=1 Tax=Candida jiufengensis TaxID=497108 RepID=UPI002223FF66|nr:MPP10 [Candida jiufengensis]KAI5951990.1 MPP10 [Candida jiufengensis]